MLESEYSLYLYSRRSSICSTPVTIKSKMNSDPKLELPEKILLFSKTLPLVTTCISNTFYLLFTNFIPCLPASQLVTFISLIILRLLPLFSPSRSSLFRIIILNFEKFYKINKNCSRKWKRSVWRAKVCI